MSQARITVGMLHPGRMGAAVAGQLRRRGTTVLWSPHGRSHATTARAAAAALEPVDDLSVLLARADVVLSLCPPAAAEDVARQIADHGFVGKIFIEANAIAPQRVRCIAHMLPKVTVVDAAVIGSPPVGGKRPKLYASGPSAALDRLDDLFATTDVQVCPSERRSARLRRSSSPTRAIRRPRESWPLWRTAWRTPTESPANCWTSPASALEATWPRPSTSRRPPAAHGAGVRRWKRLPNRSLRRVCRTTSCAPPPPSCLAGTVHGMPI